MAWSITWDETSPAVGDEANLAHVDIQDVKKSVRERIAVEHAASTGDDTDTWVHTAGTGKIAQGLAAARAAAAAANAGRVFFATDTGVISADTGGTWLNIHPHYYITGTVTVTNADATVTGVGTDFTLLAAGDVFWISGTTRYYKIASITGALALELNEVYAGTTAAGQSYYVGRYSNHEQFLPRAGGTLYDVTIDTLGGNLAAGGYKITGLGAATEAGDALNWPLLAAAVDANTLTEVMHAAGLAGGIATGSYAGDDAATQAIAGTGLDLTDGAAFIILVHRASTGGGLCFKLSSHPGLYSRQVAGAGDYWTENYIRSGDADGFTVGTDDDVNKAAVTYYYFILKAAP